MLDTDKSGFIDMNELRYVLMNFSDKITPEDIDNMIDLAD